MQVAVPSRVRSSSRKRGNVSACDILVVFAKAILLDIHVFSGFPTPVSGDRGPFHGFTFASCAGLLFQQVHGRRRRRPSPLCCLSLPTRRRAQLAAIRVQLWTALSSVCLLGSPQAVGWETLGKTSSRFSVEACGGSFCTDRCHSQMSLASPSFQENVCKRLYTKIGIQMQTPAR